MTEPIACVEAFRGSLSGEVPPDGLSVPLRALWWSGKGEWERAHELAQSVESADGAWVHAHLHRVEGDLANAGYWYRRAGREACTGSLEAEWRAISAELLGPGRTAP